MNSFRKNLSKRLVPVIVVLSFLAIIIMKAYETPDEKFDLLCTDLFKNEMLSGTLNMHYTLSDPSKYGIDEYEVILPTYQVCEDGSSEAEAYELLDIIRSISSEKLSSDRAYTQELLVRYIENQIALSQYQYIADPISPSGGMQAQLPILFAEYTFNSKQDVEDYLKLIDQAGEYFDSLILYEEKKKEKGLLQPYASLDAVKVQCDNLITKKSLSEGTHFLQQTFSERLQKLSDEGKISDKEMAKYKATNERLLTTVLQPAYENLADHIFILQDENISIGGLGQTEEGKEYYKYLLRNETGSYRDIADIKKMLMDKFDEEVCFLRDLNVAKNTAYTPESSSSASMSTNTTYGDFPLENAADMITDIRNRMKNDFPVLDCDINLTIKYVDASLKDYSAPAFYMTAPIDDYEDNVIYLNEADKLLPLELYTTLAHEGFPGHLYQTVYFNEGYEKGSQNPVREILWYGGYLEGWALYTEFMSYDYATDLLTEYNMPYQASSAQKEKHSRSLQLCLYSLLDILIHYDNADLNQISRILESYGITDSVVCETIYNYIAQEPCNYLKYYLGYLEILELKNNARNLWGADYSDYRFHKYYLDMGPSDFTTLTSHLQHRSLQ